MNITRFINSKDIRKHLESINYPFTSTEAAWLIWQCRDLTLKEKHAAWQELIDAMPDCPIEERLWVAARPSLHAFLKEYMQFQDGLIKELYTRKDNEIYAGKIWRPGPEEIYPYSTVELCLKECRETFVDEATKTYSVSKYQLDEPGKYVARADFRSGDGALMRIDQGHSFRNDFDRTIFMGSWFHFPLPFKKGDIVWNPHLSRGQCGGGPFVFEAAGLDVYQDELTKERILREADETDMLAMGYVYSEYWGEFVEEDFHAYLDLEYYRGGFDEAEDRLLPALSDCLKAEEEEQEFWSDLPETERQEILETCFPSSRAMRSYLLNAKLHKSQVLAMILGAPMMLTVKKEWLSMLSEKESDVFRDGLQLARLEKKSDGDLRTMIRRLYEKSFTDALADVEVALEQTELRDGEILYLKEYWYDDDLKGENSSGAAPFLSLEKALEYIRSDMREMDYTPGGTVWYVLEKWASNDETGEMEQLFTYYLIGDRIMWFEKMKLDKHDCWCWMPVSCDYSSESRSLNLPVPFEVGDIVPVDCTPFRPIKEAVIIENGEGVMLQALVQNEDGKWRTGAVRNTCLFSDYPLMSSLYRMERLEIPEGQDGLLSEVQDTLAARPERGAALWKKINMERQSSEDLTADEIRKMLEELKEDR